MCWIDVRSHFYLSHNSKKIHVCVACQQIDYWIKLDLNESSYGII